MKVKKYMYSSESNSSNNDTVGGTEPDFPSVRRTFNNSTQSREP